MADYVQHALEEMIPELEELQASGIFTKDEVKMIIKKRREHEYNTRRAGKELVDFLRYIEYEMNLGFLIRQRASKLNVKSKTYYATIQRIHTIFDRALKKFKGNIKLWLQYIDYAMLANSSKVLSRIFVEAIRMHPGYAPFWILSASWEYKNNDNILSARAIFQRANRMNPKSVEILFEYCRLELMYREKILTRMQIMGLSKEQLQESENKESDINEEDLPDNTDHDNGVVVKPSNNFMEGAIPLTIYEHTIKEFPKDLKLRQKFIVLFNGFKDTNHLIDKVYSDIERDFADDINARVILARKNYDLMKNNVNLYDIVTEVIENFESYILESPSSEIYVEFFKFINESKETISKDKKDHSDLIKFLDRKISILFKECQNNKLLNETIYLYIIDYYLEKKDLEKAKEMADKAHKTFPQSKNLKMVVESLNNKI